MKARGWRAAQFVVAEYPDVQTLLKEFEGLAQILYVSHNVAADHGIPKGKALKVVDTAHSNVRAKAAAK